MHGPPRNVVGPKPHELYGKFTWKIENFSETSKRELRSNVFDVGNYKWCVIGTCGEQLECGRTLYALHRDLFRYILVYPQGCDVCNHLSLFLCVADYDKLLPGKNVEHEITTVMI